MTYEDIMKVMGPQLAFLAMPRARSAVNQLGLITEAVYGRRAVHNTGSYATPSPLQPVLQQQQQLMVRVLERLSLGSKPEQLAQQFKVIREDRNQQEHFSSVEEVLNEVHDLCSQPFVPYMQDSFLRAMLVGADVFAAELLAVPRLLKLAALLLNYCQDCLDYRQGSQWLWSTPRNAKAQLVHAWVQGVLQDVPQLANDAAAFTAAADQVCKEAASYGPLQLHYSPEQLQQRVAMCLHVGLFNEALKMQQHFAFNIVTHAEVLLKVLER